LSDTTADTHHWWEEAERECQEWV
jgi:hypothetical protein